MSIIELNSINSRTQAKPFKLDSGPYEMAVGESLSFSYMDAVDYIMDFGIAVKRTTSRNGQIYKIFGSHEAADEYTEVNTAGLYLYPNGGGAITSAFRTIHESMSVATGQTTPHTPTPAIYYLIHNGFCLGTKPTHFFEATIDINSLFAVSHFAGYSGSWHNDTTYGYHTVGKSTSWWQSDYSTWTSLGEIYLGENHNVHIVVTRLN